VFVGGNEGLAEVTGVGDGVKNLERGDWVVIKASQVGTWRSAANLREDQLLKMPRLEGLSEVNAATMMVRVLSQSCLRFQSGFQAFQGWTLDPDLTSDRMESAR